MKENYKIKVKVNSEKPDFRVLAAYFFGDDFHDYDSEGNSNPLTSKNWTYLYMCSRQNKELCFEILDINDNPLIFEVSSENIETVNIIAYFLARETNGEIVDEDNNIIPNENLVKKMGNFNLTERLKSADNSIWRTQEEDEKNRVFTCIRVL
ncbi:MAG TPA: hypothetical protein PLF48_01810 [Chitinophagales bacterium]|nr:hypothetical protein [Chitinophagales bacterium]